MFKVLIVILSLALTSGTAIADAMKLAVTTSFENSGLADVLLPQIKTDLDIEKLMDLN